MGLTEHQQQTMEELFQEMYIPLLGCAQQALKNYVLAEETVQETFKIACTKADLLLSGPNPEGWLFLTLRRVMQNTVRKQAYLYHTEVFLSKHVEIAAVMDPDLSEPDLLYDDLEKNEDYQLIKRIALYKYSVPEMARELGITVEACKKRVQRAREKLKRHFITANNI